MDSLLPLQTANPRRFDVDLDPGGVGLHGELVGECFLIPNLACVLLGLIADRLAFAVALLGARLERHPRDMPANRSAAIAATTIKTVVLVAISAPYVG